MWEHLYTLSYLFIILIKVFDLKVVDPEWCFNLKYNLKEYSIIIHHVKQSESFFTCYENNVTRSGKLQ